VTAPILIVYAHPYPKRSHANRALLDAVRDLQGVELRSLYTLYPDFDIDVAAEQAALEKARIVVWQHPLYWYTAPGMLKHWFDKVLTRGWAYGDGGTALAGKICQWVTSTGGDDASYQPGCLHEHVFQAFVPVVAQTARFCGMAWQEPLVVHGAHKIDDHTLKTHAERYRSRLIDLARRDAPDAA